MFLLHFFLLPINEISFHWIAFYYRFCSAIMCLLHEGYAQKSHH